MADSKVDLGAGSSDFSGMSMNEAFGLEPGDEGYMGLFPGPVYKDDGTSVTREGAFISDLDTGGKTLHDAVKFERSADRVSPYEGLADPAYDFDTPMEFFELFQDGKLFPNTISGKTGTFVPRRVEQDADGNVTVVPIGFQEGGSVEEVGIMGALLRPSIDLPDSASQDMVRQSAREGSEGASMFYPEGAPTFEQVLETKYGYPADVDRSDFETTSELMRAERPRYDLPTYQEMEDARAHALQTALLAQQVGPETAQGLGSISEFVDKTFLGATSEDVAMDKRNNAFGAQLLKKAGINATPQQITKMVDQAVFDQLDTVLGRKPGERRFKSPDTGIDIFFPRDKYGYFNVNRYD